MTMMIDDGGGDRGNVTYESYYDKPATGRKHLSPDQPWYS
jgi:hypothetical protein